MTQQPNASQNNNLPLGGSATCRITTNPRGGRGVKRFPLQRSGYFTLPSHSYLVPDPPRGRVTTREVRTI